MNNRLVQAQRPERPLLGTAIAWLCCVFTLLVGQSLPAAAEIANRQVVLSFDDLPLNEAARTSDQELTKLTTALLRPLRERRLPAIGFVNENKLMKDNEPVADRIDALDAWLDAGLDLGNHSYSHPDLHRVPLKDYLADVRRGEQITRQLLEEHDKSLDYFRHPYLHTGTDVETRKAVEADLASRDVAVAPVTIDNSEWIFARAYERAHVAGDDDMQKRLADAYLEYMDRMFGYYEGQSSALFGREIPQILLLHANRLNSDLLPGLLDVIAERGYRVVDLATALRDPAYRSADDYVGRGGITWLHRWALTAGKAGSFFAGQPACPQFVQDYAGISE